MGRHPDDTAQSRVIVMKFGGTSVATREGRDAVAARVTEALEADLSPVIVVSAMGRAGDPYATDTLLGLLDGLPIDERERDLLASTGEVVSAVVLAHELRARGVAARALTGPEAGIRTDGAHGAARITEIVIDRLADLIAAREVPVVCGFQGLGPDGSVCTLGRGGSDTTACALGVALSAREVEIYSDVDGVMTADPRTCPDAQVLSVVSAEELFQMAKAGSRIVHTPAAELALSSGIGVRVRNTFTDHPGTRVADIASYRPAAVATAVTHLAGIARVRVALPGTEGSLEHTRAQAGVYQGMASAGISLDMFTPHDGWLVFTVAEADLPRAVGVLRNLGLQHDAVPGFAKVTLVGAGMHGVPGVMARIASAFADAGIPVLQTADSHTTISVLVDARDATAAVAALHEAFGLSDARKDGAASPDDAPPATAPPPRMSQ